MIDGSLARPNLRPSLYGRPHKVMLAGTASLPLRVRVGLTYIGVLGNPFSYIATGDPNADGLSEFGQRNNDPVYVPLDASDITLVDPADYTKLDEVIRSTPCLRAQRGRLAQCCRAGWNGRLDARVTKVVPTTGGQALELTADLFNVLNFVDSDWARTTPSAGACRWSNWSAMTPRTVAGSTACRTLRGTRWTYRRRAGTYTQRAVHLLTSSGFAWGGATWPPSE